MRKSVVGSISALCLSCWLTPGLVHAQVDRRDRPTQEDTR